MDPSQVAVLAAMGAIALCFLAIVFGLWYQYRDEPENPLQEVPTVPRVTLPIHETNVRTINKLKAAEPEPETLVEKDFDPEGADQTRKTRLRELIRDTQTKQV